MFIRHRDLLAENERLRRWLEEAGENAERALALMAQCDAERIEAVRQSQGQTFASYDLLDEVRSAASTERRDQQRIAALEQELAGMQARLHASERTAARLTGAGPAVCSHVRSWA